MQSHRRERVFLLSSLVVGGSALLVEMATARAKQRLAVAGASLIAAASFWLAGSALETRAGESDETEVRVAAFQFAPVVPPAGSTALGLSSDWFSALRQILDRAPRLIVLPETIASHAVQLDGISATKLGAGRQASAELWTQALIPLLQGSDAFLVIGLEGVERGVTHNSTTVWGERGLVGWQHKVRLVPFAEYLPWGWSFLGSQSLTHYRPGERYLPIDAGKFRIGSFICQEVQHAGTVRELARRGARCALAARRRHDRRDHLRQRRARRDDGQPDDRGREPGTLRQRCGERRRHLLDAGRRLQIGIADAGQRRDLLRDRTARILELVEPADRVETDPDASVEAAGADFLVIPCNTAHVFEQAIIDAVDIPLVSIIDETINAIPDDCTAVGLLATGGCLQAGVYQRALEARRIRVIEPTAAEVDELMRAVTAIKAGEGGSNTGSTLRSLAEALVARGAGASYAVMGDAVALGGGVRLSAEVYDLAASDLLGRVRVEGAAGRTVEVRLEARHGDLILQIQDNGRGITAGGSIRVQAVASGALGSHSGINLMTSSMACCCASRRPSVSRCRSSSRSNSTRLRPNSSRWSTRPSARPSAEALGPSRGVSTRRRPCLCDPRRRSPS